MSVKSACQSNLWCWLASRPDGLSASCADLVLCSAEERKFQDTGAGHKRQTAMQRVREREKEQRQQARQEAINREKALRCTFPVYFCKTGDESLLMTMKFLQPP